MVIFTSNLNIIQQINNPIIYNLSSYYSGFEDLSSLITKISVFNATNMPINEFIYSPQFDNMYAQGVFNNDELFTDFLKIVLNATLGNIIVLISHDPYRDAITESIIKLIQVRYGYNCWEIEDVDDLSCLRESFFTPQGILNLDQDKYRYDMLSINGFNKPLNNLKNSET